MSSNVSKISDFRDAARDLWGDWFQPLPPAPPHPGDRPTQSEMYAWADVCDKWLERLTAMPRTSLTLITRKNP